ncbi:hypothetical protein ACFQ1I_27515 [Kitasatospora arboriphila]
MRDHSSPQAGRPTAAVPLVGAQRSAPPHRDERPGLAERLGYLETATRRINGSLDLRTTLRDLGRSLVPALADAAVVHLRDPLPPVERDPGPPTALRLHHGHGTRLGRRSRLCRRRPAARSPGCWRARRRTGPRCSAPRPRTGCARCSPSCTAPAR